MAVDTGDYELDEELIGLPTITVVGNVAAPLTDFDISRIDAFLAPPGGMPGVPPPITLPEVIVTAPKPQPVPPSIIGPIVNLVSRIATPIVGLLTPLTAGPRALDEAPSPPTEVLPEVVVSAPPPKPPAKPPVSMDPIQPPNWGDLAQPTWRTPYEIPQPPGILPRLIDFTQKVWRYWDDALELLNQPGQQPLPDTRPRRRTGDASPLGVPTPSKRFDPLVWPFPSDSPLPGLAPELLPAPSTPGRAPTRQPRPTVPGVETRPRTQPGRRVAPAPEISPFPWALPLPGPTVVPAPDVFAPPVAAPRTPAAPAPYVPPWADVPDPTIRTPWLDPTLDPDGRFAPPRADADRCNCAPEKKDRKKKRKPRNICFRGTYTEKSNGLIKRRKEQIPCQ